MVLNCEVSITNHINITDSASVSQSVSQSVRAVAVQPPAASAAAAAAAAAG